MPSARLWSKDYVFLLLAVFFASFTHNVFLIVLPVYVLDIGGSNTVTGLMMTGLTVAGICIRIVMAPLVDRIGRKKILVLGSATFALNTIAFCFVRDIPGLFCLQVINGIAQGIYFPVPPTLVGDIVPRERLVDGMGFFGIAASLSASLAPTVGLSLYEAFGPLVLFTVSSIFAVISAGFTTLVREHYKVPETEKKMAEAPPQDAFRPRGFRPLAVLELAVIVPALINFLVCFGNSSVINYLAPCGLARGIAGISTFFFVNNMTIILTRMLTGRLERRFGKIRLIAVGCLLNAAGIILIAFSHHTVPVLLAALLFGSGLSLTTQLQQVRIVEMVPENRRGVANATLMLFGDLGTGSGSMVWGSVTEGLGYTAAYLLSACSGICAAGVHLTKYAWKKTRRNAQ